MFAPGIQLYSQLLGQHRGRQLPSIGAVLCSLERDDPGCSRPRRHRLGTFDLHAARHSLGIDDTAERFQLMLPLRVGLRSVARLRVRPWHRSFQTASVLHATKPPDKINYNTSFGFDDAPDADHVHFRRVTANDLEKLSSPPTEVKMLVRDFIEDSLYNPQYGYFPKQATIFTAMKPVDFNSLRDSAEFQEEVASRYARFETNEEGPGRQIWHTPTELFKVCLTSACLLRTR